MGDIADMMLEGLLDEETGEYIGDINEDIYGMAAPGFPISYEREQRERHAPRGQAESVMFGKYNCPICKKAIKKIGLLNHIEDSHPELSKSLFKAINKHLIEVNANG